MALYGSSAQDNLGQLHIVTGRIIYTTGVPALTCNDNSATVADTGAGNPTVTFGEAFLSAPQATASVLKGTHVAGELDQVHIEACTTTSLELQVQRATDTGVGATDVAAQDPDDTEGIMFICIGLRDN